MFDALAIDLPPWKACAMSWNRFDKFALPLLQSPCVWSQIAVDFALKCPTLDNKYKEKKDLVTPQCLRLGYIFLQQRGVRSDEDSVLWWVIFSGSRYYERCRLTSLELM